MKAYVLHGIGDLRYDEVELPVLEEDTVLVEVQAMGICGSDIPRIYRTGAYSHPLIPGHEFAGKVAQIGKSVEKDWLNKRVGVFPMMPCMKCPQCLRKQYEMCSNYNYLGSRTDGGFAEYVRVPVWNLIELPENVSFEQAAMLEPASVAMHALRAMNVKTDETAAVCGLGAIGLMIAMLLKGMGCDNVLVIGNKDIQRKMAADIGITDDDFCDMRKSGAVQWLEEKTSGYGVDVFFDCVGRNQVLNEAIQSVRAGGRIMLVGNPASDVHMDKNIYWKILRKQLTLKGTWNSSYTHEVDDDWHRILNLMKDGKIYPEKFITHRFEFADLMRGTECMRDKAEEYVKMMVRRY